MTVFPDLPLSYNSLHHILHHLQGDYDHCKHFCCDVNCDRKEVAVKSASFRTVHKINLLFTLWLMWNVMLVQRTLRQFSKHSYATLSYKDHLLVTCSFSKCIWIYFFSDCSSYVYLSPELRPTFVRIKRRKENCFLWALHSVFMEKVKIDSMFKNDFNRIFTIS